MPTLQADPAAGSGRWSPATRSDRPVLDPT